LASALLPVFVGCASFGRRGAEADAIAAGRELCRSGITAMEMGNLQQAEAMLQKSVEAAPEDADGHRYLAEALWRRGAAGDALEHIQTASRLDPNDARLTVRAGEMALAAGAPQDALTYAEKSIGLEPRLASAWALRGRVFWRLQQLERTMADLQRAAELAPQSRDTLLDLAVLYRELGQGAQALTTLRYLLDSYSPGEEQQAALYLEGLTLLELGRPHHAVESLTAAVHRGPPNADVLYQLARAQRDAGRHAEAAATVEKALALNSSHAPSRDLLTQLAGQVEASDANRR
jgi:tetratricopeptide (TPR) repeat protein